MSYCNLGERQSFWEWVAFSEKEKKNAIDSKASVSIGN